MPRIGQSESKMSGRDARICVRGITRFGRRLRVLTVAWREADARGSWSIIICPNTRRCHRSHSWSTTDIRKNGFSKRWTSARSCVQTAIEFDTSRKQNSQSMVRSLLSTSILWRAAWHGNTSGLVEQNIGRRENKLRSDMTKPEVIGKMANLIEDPDRKVRLPNN